MQSYPQQTSMQVGRNGPGFLLRAIWFLLVGWWLGFFWLHIGYLLCVTIILLPFGIIMLNNLPTVLTLRSRNQVSTSTVNAAGMTVETRDIRQRNFLLRILYFILIGWWAGLLWAWIGYLCTVSVILLPIGLMMLNRLPSVVSLHRF